jgi:hypothetical protein
MSTETEVLDAEATPETGEPVAPGTLVVQDKSALELAEEQFPMARREQVAAFLNIQAENPALLPYLGICAKYGLDPTMGQIWLIEKKIKVRDGDSGNKVDRYVLAPTVGRDGLLAVAQRQPEFEGMLSGVVCERDSFEVEYTGSREDPKVIHRYASKPTVFDDDEDARLYRGRILGAWAKVYVRGRFPTYFYADLKEYGQTGTGSDGSKYWRGAWAFTQAMILKAAQSMALRVAIGVTGIEPADELAGATAEMAQDAHDPEEGIEEFLRELEIPEQLKTDLGLAFQEANELEPFSWSIAKVKMRLEGRSEGEARQVLAEVQHEVQVHQRNEARAEGAKIPAKSLEKGAQLFQPEGWVTVTECEVLKTKVKVSLEGVEDPLDFKPEDPVLVRQTDAS